MRRSNRGRSARFDWDEPPSLVGVMLFAKGDAKTQISLAHEKLPDAETAERIKLMWRERLTALKACSRSGAKRRTIGESAPEEPSRAFARIGGSST